ncbi:MAG: DUF4080 domain-containing protein [Proteobacteria bacterium]|nr:DUF4080 domain-containing protein [Pseudomonadota bacterium]
MQIRLIAFNGRYIHSCLALFYVREELRKNLPAAAIELRQLTINDPYYQTLLSISEGSPFAIFFSVYIWNSELVLQLLDDLARILPEVPFVLGGPQAAAFSRDQLPAKTTVIKGEVEGLSPSFYEDLQHNRLAPVYECRPGGPFPSPYTDGDLTGVLHNRHIYYESCRGCPFSCSYCLSSVERGMNRKDVEQVKRELAAILKHRPKIIKFVDRTFNANADRALEIWRFLSEQGGETLFHFEMAPDLFSEEMFAFLAELPPGRFQFELGIQSTHPETLAAVNRLMDLKKVGENIRRLAALDNIHLHADLILGLPEETASSFRNGVREVFAMGPHYIQMGLLKVLPGTGISGVPGLVHSRKPPYQVLATPQMDHRTLSHLYWLGECLEAFHNNRYFPCLFAYLRETGEDICTFFEELLKVCRARNFFSLSATQEFCNSLLCEVISGRNDCELIRELLRYDWLRCGHRFLPEPLADENLAELRKHLSRTLGVNFPPYYDYRSRDEFFRKSFFAAFSGSALQRLGLGDGTKDGIVCFLPDREPGIHSFQKVCLLPG